MNKTKAQASYWIFQSIGWGFFCITNSLFQYPKLGNESILFSVYISLFGILITHSVRWIILTFSIIEKKTIILVGTIIALVVSSAIMGSVLFFGVILTIRNLFLEPLEAEFEDVLSSTFNMGLVYAIWILIYFAYLYFQAQKRSTIEKFELELILKDAQLNDLKKQLSPHFLFNSLNNIRSLILEDQHKAREAVTHISDILRYALNYQEKELVMIAEEMEVVKAYIELNKMHYDNKVMFNIVIEEEALSYKIPPMSIQLMVENALKHGVAKTANTTFLNVRIFLDRYLIIEVENEGKLLKNENVGLGVFNLKSRLYHSFKDKCSFQLEEKEGLVKATIKLYV